MIPPTTHDYTDRAWGHDYVIHSVHDDGLKLDASGWGEGVKTGDFMLLQNGNTSTRYQVATISYLPDPRDMWRAELGFAPREEEG